MAMAKLESMYSLWRRTLEIIPSICCEMLTLFGWFRWGSRQPASERMMSSWPTCCGLVPSRAAISSLEAPVMVRTIVFERDVAAAVRALPQCWSSHPVLRSLPPDRYCLIEDHGLPITAITPQVRFSLILCRNWASLARLF